MDSAYGILLSGREDDEIQDYFIRTAFPPLNVMTDVLKALEKASPLTLDQLGAQLNYGRNAMQKALTLLEVEGVAQHERAGYSRTANPWRPEPARFESVTRQRRAELAEIQRYVQHPGCLMEFLARALDDPTAAPCGKCMNCTGKTHRLSAPAELVQQAAGFLRQDSLILEPRARWPRPLLEDLKRMLPSALEHSEASRPKALIPSHLQAREGRVLCIYGDAGWGKEVARGKYETGKFSDLLVKAAAELVSKKWRPDPPPQWLVPIPSRHHPLLVQDFAQRLALELELRLMPVLQAHRTGKPQKEMRNSAMQLRNVLEAFQVVEPSASKAEPAGARDSVHRVLEYVEEQLRGNGTHEPRLAPAPILLVDDMVDSGWTLTMAAVLLQAHGSGPVFPLALAKASPRGG